MDELGRPRRGDAGVWGDDSGASLVEMAMVLVLLVMLLVGIISAATAYGRGNSIQNAAREASRFGATLPGGGTALWLGDVRDVARAAASGDLDSSVSGQFICVAFGDGSAWSGLTDTEGAEASTTSSCFSDGRPVGEYRVQVVTQRETEIQAVLFNTDINLSADAAARYEREP